MLVLKETLAYDVRRLDRNKMIDIFGFLLKQNSRLASNFDEFYRTAGNKYLVYCGEWILSETSAVAIIDAELLFKKPRKKKVVYSIYNKDFIDWYFDGSEESESTKLTLINKLISILRFDGKVKLSCNDLISETNTGLIPLSLLVEFKHNNEVGEIDLETWCEVNNLECTLRLC